MADMSGTGSPERQSAATSHRCTETVDNLAYGLLRCDRFAGHDGQHEAFPYDLAWGPPEPGWTGTPQERGEEVNRG